MDKLNTVQTPNFKLSVYTEGNIDSPKLALLLPGQLDSKDYPHMRSHVDYLASKGFYSVSFDPPGTWESSGDISQYTMTNYIKAINELVEHFGKRPTLFMGHSRGGAMAMLAGTTSPQTLAFISVFSNYSYDSKVNSLYNDDEWKSKGYKESWRDLPFDSIRKRSFKLPYAFVEDQKQYDMLDGLRKCTKPKLFFLGTRDPLIKPETVRKAYETAAEPKQLRELDSDHDYRWHPELIRKVNLMAGDFLKEHAL